MKALKWTNSKLHLPTDIARNFRSPAAFVKLAVGTEICRLRTNRPDCAGQNILESPWWFSRSTFNRIVGRATRAHVSITTSGRDGLAVGKNFNEDFDTLVIFMLLRPGFAWCGPAGPQLWTAGGQTLLRGGLEQMWIPGLEDHDVHFKFFGSVVDRL
jgi:hypothetical protein